MNQSPESQFKKFLIIIAVVVTVIIYAIIKPDFFSNLKLLELEDIIKIYNLNSSCVLYKVYDKFEVLPSDLSCTVQDNTKKEITLITCNNQNKKRLIIKAKENR